MAVTYNLHIEALTKLLLARLDEDYDRPGLVETPERVAKAWGFWTSGYNDRPETILKTFEDGAEDYDEMVFQGRIPLYSHCEHHLAPFFGVAHIGYIPNGCIVGLSKLSRVVDMYARRLQVQERITRQVADCLNEHLQPIGVGVVIRCRHLCMESRGIQKAGTVTYTSALRGAIKDHGGARTEFLKFVERADEGYQI
jgi:GTP cyclohydrolase I